MVRKFTDAGRLLGISMPTYGWPGIGASIRKLSTCIFRANLSCRLVIRDNGIPRCGSRQYCVTRGPTLALWTLPPMPNSARVLSICCARNLMLPGSALRPSLDNSLTSGNFQLELLIIIAGSAFSILLTELTSKSCGTALASFCDFPSSASSSSSSLRRPSRRRRFFLLSPSSAASSVDLSLSISPLPSPPTLILPSSLARAAATLAFCSSSAASWPIKSWMACTTAPGEIEKINISRISIKVTNIKAAIGTLTKPNAASATAQPIVPPPLPACAISNDVGSGKASWKVPENRAKKITVVTQITAGIRSSGCLKTWIICTAKTTGITKAVQPTNQRTALAKPTGNSPPIPNKPATSMAVTTARIIAPTCDQKWLGTVWTLRAGADDAAGFFLFLLFGGRPGPRFFALICRII